MNQAHLHLLFNHLPILGTLFGILVLLTGLLLRNPSVKRTALGVFILSAGFAAVASFTGEGAEEAVESLSGVGEALIGRHEDMAEMFLFASIAVGAIALLTFLSDLFSWKVTKALYILVLAGAAGTMVLAQKTGTTGGEIRHPEIRAEITQNDPYQNPAVIPSESGENEEEDD